MKSSIRLFLSGARTSWITYFVEITPITFVGLRIPRMLLQTLFFVLLARAAGGSELARFALIGNAIQIAVFNAMLSMVDIVDAEKWNNTFQYLIAAPSNWLPIMLGKSISSYGEAIFSAVVSFAVLIPLLDIPIELINLLRAIPAALVIIASASALGWLIGAIALPVRWGYAFGNWLAYLMIVLCGVNVPFSSLPIAVQWLGKFIPVTHGLLAVRAIVDGATYSSTFSNLLIELAVCIVYASFAWLVFGWRLKVTRQMGSIELT